MSGLYYFAVTRAVPIALDRSPPLSVNPAPRTLEPPEVGGPTAFLFGELMLPTRCGHAMTLSEVVTGWKWMPGFVVYLYPYKDQVLVYNPFIKLRFLKVDMTRTFRTVQSIPQVLRDTLRWAP